MTDPITPERIAELRRLLEAATPEPWESQEHLGNAKRGRVKGPKRTKMPDCEGGGEAIPSVDAQLIVALRNAAPALLERIEELERDLSRVRRPMRYCNQQTYGGYLCALAPGHEGDHE